MPEFKQTNQFVKVASLISSIVDNYLASKMKEAVDVDSTMNIIIKEQVQSQVSKIMPKIEKYVTESLGAKVLVDQDKDEDPFAGSNQGSKRRRSGKEAESSKEPTHKESKSTSQDEDGVDEETDMNDDSEETKSDNDGDDLTHPNLSTYKADDEEKEKKADDEEVSSDQRVSTPLDYELTDEKENKEGDDKDKEGEHVQDEEDDLYSDVKINMERSDDEMTDAQANQDTKDSHVTNSCASSSATLKFFCFIRRCVKIH
nr:hypothetical protein [Tanacetum cinerariifolium]